MFNVQKFRDAGLAFGGARPSLFAVSMVFPRAIAIPSGSPEKASFLIRSASIPASTLGQIEVPYAGRKIKVSGDRTYSDWNITVMNDEDWGLRQAFEEWHRGINEWQGNFMIPPFVDAGSTAGTYKVDLAVTQFSKDGETPIAEYAFIGAFPTEIGPIQLDWETTNQIETFDVTFAYDYWVASGSSGGLATATVTG
jgi:T4-like virus tail tube protein gp19